MTAPGPILSRLGLQQYIERLAEEGFETWESILDITESDLDALKVKLGHRRVLQREIASARGLKVDQGIFLRSQPQTHVSPEPGPSALDDGNDLQISEAGPRQKRRYRRHPKPDENAPERPPSAYVLFSNKIRDNLKPLNLSFTEIAKRVGENWQVLSPAEKEPYETQAAASKEKYNREMAVYKLTDSYRDYQKYLTDFKLKHGSHTDEHRPRLEHEHSNASSSSIGTSPEGSRHPSTQYEVPRRRLEPMGLNAPAPSPGPIDTVTEPQQERNLYPRRSQQNLPRIVPNESGPSPMSSTKTTPTTPRPLQSRRSPFRTADQIPAFMHEPSSHTSDSSKSSVTSGQSSVMTAATSLSVPRGSEDDSKHNLVLPPISSLASLPCDATPFEHHQPWADHHAASKPGSVPYGSYRGSQPLLPSLTDRPSEPKPPLISSPSDLREDISDPQNSPFDAPRTAQQSTHSSEQGVSTDPDPLTVLADAAHAGSASSDVQASPKF